MVNISATEAARQQRISAHMVIRCFSYHCGILCVRVYFNMSCPMIFLFWLLEILPIDWRRVYFEARWCCKHIKMLGSCLTYSEQPSKVKRTTSDREGNNMLFCHMYTIMLIRRLWLPRICQHSFWYIVICCRP